MTGFTIRRLQVEDLKKGFFETLDNLTILGSVDHEKSAKVFEEITKNPVYNIFVALNENSEVVGTTTLIVLQKFTRSYGKAGIIEDVVTRKGWEGKGIATALLQVAEEEAKKQGCYKIILNTRTEKVSDWYRKRGYFLRGFELRKDLFELEHKYGKELNQKKE